jgi:hypothetical protein
MYYIYDAFVVPLFFFSSSCNQSCKRAIRIMVIARNAHHNKEAMIFSVFLDMVTGLD